MGIRLLSAGCGFLFAVFGLAAQAAHVVGIADGDTLTVLEGHVQLKIRLANIDAPEKKQAFGERSRQSLAEMCFGQDAHYQAQNIDRYGRTVAVVWCSGVEVNRAQVERGMAWVYPRYNKDPSLPASEEKARADKRGLWSDAAPVPPWDFRRTR